MRQYRKIIVEGSAEDWSAWFEESPSLSAGGECPGDAIWKLLILVGEHEFSAVNIMRIDEATREGHLEFWIPLTKRRKIPKPSVN